ncbi:U3 snoRNP protein Utp4 [Schizosaccharomyces octosporus yFS286]|uniref:U3 snoRNP protein Utp4 n=1 Tax=Schizosaccharomyces octosporus (strain yFS286) TaxID=483514 RepID=S9PUG1_SCHOY|nr:U3 snoRNP protein Utp4 [Schizosaccharomyces octosporus yFS286]EPX71108.1 U3 snoRNP protein Utp4 [Schizosaccharomyces octosporus yFS286]
MDIHRCRFVEYTPSPITALAFSHQLSSQDPLPSNLHLAVGRANGNIEIWTPKGDWCLKGVLYGGVNRSVEGLAWSVSDEELRLFSIGFSTSITEWNLQTGKPLVHQDSNAGAIWSISLHEETNTLAAGCDDGSCVLFDISGGRGVIEYKRTLMRQTSRILSLCWQGKNHLVGGCADGIVKVWDVESPNSTIIARMQVDRAKKGSRSLVWDVKSLKDNTIVTADSSGAVKFWNGKYFTLTQSFKLHSADVLTLAVSSNGNIVFSSGIDRKTVQYTRDGGKREWVSNSFRRFHSHDVRCMSILECKTVDVLVSGGADMMLAVVPVRQFNAKHHRMIPAVPQKPRMAIATQARLFMLWEDHQVLVWRIGSPGYRFLLKIVLQDEENIVHAAISQNGELLAVSTIQTTKLYRVHYTDDKVYVESVEDPFLSSVGATLLQFTVDMKKLILISNESDIFLLDLSRIETHQLEVFEVSQPETKKAPSKYRGAVQSACEGIATVSVSPDGDYFAIADLHGNTFCYSFSTLSYIELPRVNSFVRAMAFRSDIPGRLAVVTAGNQVFEFDVQSRKLTEWSKTNSNNMPKPFAHLLDKPFGAFFDIQNPSRFWIWSANYVSFFDLSLNLPTNRNAEKRKMEGTVDGTSSTKQRSSVQNATSLSTFGTGASRSFWITHKYRPMLLVGLVGSTELLVIERPIADILMSTDVPGTFYEHRFGA